MAKKLVDSFWMDGKRHDVYQTGQGEFVDDEIEMSEYEFLYGEEDPDDTGEHYDEWMPRYGGNQPDDND